MTYDTYGDRYTAKDRLSKKKESNRTMPPLSHKFPTKLRDSRKVLAMQKALKEKQK